MAKSVTVTLSIPEPGDPLPHTVIENGDYEIAYVEDGQLMSGFVDPMNPVPPIVARALGIPNTINVKAEVAE